MKQLFPKEIIENTVEVHQFRHKNSSKIIYSIILCSMLLAFAVLPLIKVDIFTTAKGMLKPSKERISITPLQSGKIVYANIKDNLKVKKGDTLLIVNQSPLSEKINLSNTQINEVNQFIEDCEYLVRNKAYSIKNISTPKYQKEYLYYSQKLHELQNIVEKTKMNFERNEKLYKKGVIAKVEFEDSSFEYKQAQNNLNQYQNQQKNNWQASLTEYKNNLRELESNNAQLQMSQNELIIKAPIEGVLKNIKGLEIGSLINGGSSVAEISPNTALIAECFLSPSDIGLLEKGKQVNFQIDAFNYNQWGLATGKIIDISKDIDIINNQPVFKVLCSVDQSYLELKNGFKGNFNKGMTLNARFQLTERTLFQLLYDKFDDWLNPSRPKDVAKL